MLMIKCIILICGPPACLKSTLMQILRLIFKPRSLLNLEYLCVKRLFETFCMTKDSNKSQYNFLSFDDLFANYENDIITNESNWKTYRLMIADEIEKIILSDAQKSVPMQLKYATQILDRLHHSLQNLAHENILIIEDNFYYSSMRHRYRQIAQRAQIGFASIHLYSDIKVALQRNQNRDLSKRVSDMSIRNIYSKYDLSDDDFVIDTTHRGLTTEHLNIVLRRIQRACREPEQQWNIADEERRQAATDMNHQNVLYQADQRLRKFISKYLKEEFVNNEKFTVPDEKKHFAEAINNKRQIFLELIRRKWILLNNNEDDIDIVFRQFLKESSE